MRLTCFRIGFTPCRPCCVVCRHFAEPATPCHRRVLSGWAAEGLWPGCSLNVFAPDPGWAHVIAASEDQLVAANALRTAQTPPPPPDYGPSIGPSFAHIDEYGRRTPYGPADNAVIGHARAAGASEVMVSDVRLPSGAFLQFAVRFGQNAVSSRMPRPSQTGMCQVNIHNDNTRLVEELQQTPAPAPPAYAPAPPPPPAYAQGPPPPAYSTAPPAYAAAPPAPPPSYAPAPAPAYQQAPLQQQPTAAPLQMMLVTVPSGVGPGSTIQVQTPTGQMVRAGQAAAIRLCACVWPDTDSSCCHLQVQLTVPAGVFAGQQLQIQV